MHLGWTTSINAPASLGATRVGADALTYVLPAPIRRINSGSSTPGWQCMFGPSPYIGVLSPEQRPWRRSCHHRSHPCGMWGGAVDADVVLRLFILDRNVPWHSDLRHGGDACSACLLLSDPTRMWVWALTRCPTSFRCPSGWRGGARQPRAPSSVACGLSAMARTWSTRYPDAG